MVIFELVNVPEIGIVLQIKLPLNDTLMLADFDVIFVLILNSFELKPVLEL